MNVILVSLAVILALVGLLCSIIILIEAFKDEIWKGFVCLLCGLYFLYYALFEFEHERKWLIVLGSLFCGGLGSVLVRLGMPAPN